MERAVALTVEFAAKRYNKGKIEDATIPLARELPFTLFVNDKEILSIATLPVHLGELFTGFLIAEGVIVEKSDIIQCHVDYDARIVRMDLDVPDSRLAIIEQKGMLTSGCAGGVIFSVKSHLEPQTWAKGELPMSSRTILDRMLELDTYKGIYSVTRGVHAASVASSSETLAILEDIGRHNAVDKIVGYCFLNEIETADKLLLTTGRITSEVLIKASKGRFPIVVSRSSASAAAISMAKQSRIDVATYVRGGRFNYFENGACRLTQDIGDPHRL